MSENKKKSAGGRATEAGMSFQARVGSWFAAQLLSNDPIGSKFGIDVTARAVALQFETGNGMDDIQVDLSTKGHLLVQCKTTLNLEAKADSSFAKVVAQLVESYDLVRSATPPMPATSVAAVLAVATGKSASLNDLESVCRLFQYGAKYQEVAPQASAAQSKALSIFRAHIDRIWSKKFGHEPSDDDLAALCRLFRLARFDADDSGHDRLEAVRAITLHLKETGAEGELIWPVAVDTVRSLIQTGAKCDRSGFLQALVRSGAIPQTVPAGISDVERLRRWTERELHRLERHAILPGTKITIDRRCAKPLDLAIEGGSLLVTGEPGAGKTGELVALARRRVGEGKPTVFLSVDSVPDVDTATSLAAEIELKGSITQALKDWEGDAGVLFLDALDASRGGASERAFIELIEKTLEEVGDKWSVIASIRTFDLQNGKKFRQLMAGNPPDAQFSNGAFSKIRHFEIPRLCDEELDNLGAVSPGLAVLLSEASTSVRQLLSNVFNLSLAAQLLKDGKAPSEFRNIGTQAALIEMYEGDRIPSHREQVAVRETVTAMVERQRLTVPRYHIRNDELETVLESGLLVQDGDRIGFAHHILFDHAAGRYFLDWDDVGRLVKQVRSLKEVGFLLGPALQFAQRRIWDGDGPGKTNSWKFISEAAAGTDTDPILRSVAIRVATDSVTVGEDLGGLLAILRDKSEPSHRLFSTLCRFAAMNLTEAGQTLEERKALAWGGLARDVALLNHVPYVDGIRYLLVALFERRDVSAGPLAIVLGKASRHLLSLCWQKPQNLDVIIVNAVRFVGRTYWTDIQASSALFYQAFEDAHFKSFAHLELPWIAESAGAIARYDPTFVENLYEIAFTRSAPNDQKTWLGGPSQIMGLTSTAAQDYDQARWQLKEAFPTFLAENPFSATRALIHSLIGLARSDRKGLLFGKKEKVAFDAVGIEVLQDHYSIENWESEHVHPSDSAGELLQVFSAYLRSCPAEVFIDLVGIISNEASPSSMWNRILGTVAKRPDVDCQVIQSVFADRSFMEMVAWRREAVSLLGTRFASGDQKNKEEIERFLIAGLNDADPTRAEHWMNITRRFFGVIDQKSLQTEELKSLLAQMKSEGENMANAPLVSFSRSAGRSSDDVTAMLLQRQGADLSLEPNALIYEARRRIEARLPVNGPPLTSNSIIELWAVTRGVIATLRSESSRDPHVEVLHATWGAVSNAIEAIVKSDAYSLDFTGHPSANEGFDLIVELAGNQFPEPAQDDSNSSMAWGNWDVRVYAAASLLHLIVKVGDSDPRMFDLAIKLINDPVPTVRLQLAQSLNGLWDAANSWMWNLTAEVARNEHHPGVLGFFVSGPLGIMAYHETARVTEFASLIVQRVGSASNGENKRYQLNEGLGHLAAHLWIGLDVSDAFAWVLGWLNDENGSEGLVWSFISAIREALFLGFKSGASERDIALRNRTLRIAEAIVEHSATEIQTVQLEWSSQSDDQGVRDTLQARYASADRLVGHLINQFYFGSGAFSSRQELKEPGLDSDNEKRAFLSVYGSLLDQIGAVASPSTLHHLVELYEFLAPADPEAIFDKVVASVLGAGKDRAFQYESMGADVLVRLVKVYLADYRAVFVDKLRLGRLIQVLELFSDAGWPEALRLLYDLPEILR